MINSRHRHHRIIVTVIVGIALLMCSGVGMAKTVRIAIFPFQIHAAENLEFMQSGIFEMLAGRLESADAGSDIIQRQVVLDQIADIPVVSLADEITAAQALHADYFISGSLTVFGERISTDAKLFDSSGDAALVSFNQTGSAQGDIITHIDRFAFLVNRKIFDQATGSNGQNQLGTPQRQLPMTDKPGSLGIVLQDGHPSQPTTGGLVIAEDDGSRDGRWRSDTFQTHLVGVSIGDVDGDGANESVVVDKSTVWVYRFENDGMVKTAHFERSPFDQFLTVDVADINDNGKAEIFITNYAKFMERPVSLVLEFTANGLTLLSEEANWYYRVFSTTGQRYILAAQKYDEQKLFSASVQLRVFKSGAYVSVDTIAPPKNLTIYDMALALKTRNSEERKFVGYVWNNRIAALLSNGDAVWTTTEEFGGSLNYFEYRDRDFKEVADYYIPKRIILTDIDHNGDPEVIAATNVNSSPSFMSKWRRYKKGFITCLEWGADDEVRSKWQTVEEHGYISDLAVADATNDGKADLVFSVVSDVKADAEKSSSYLVIQQLP